MITAILRFASEEDDIGKAPRMRKLQEPKRVPLAFTADEFLAILSVTDRTTGTICGIPTNDWWRGLLCVGWEAGLRITALLSLASRDVLLDQSGLFSQAEDQKDKEADWYPLSPETTEAVRRIYDTRRTLLFPCHLTLNGLRRRFRTIMKRSGIYAPKGAGMAFHRLRRSTASYTAAAGGDATKKLCHSSPKITARYIDPRVVRPSRNADLVPAPILK